MTEKMTPAARRSYETTVLPLTGELTRKAVALTRNASEADDLVQDTLVRAYRGWHTYDAERCTPKAWLFTVLRNTFRNQWQALNRRRDVTGTAGREGVTNMAAMPTPDAGDTGRMVRAAVDSLPADFRAVVVAVDLEGASYLEAAAALGVPKGTVMSRLSRARARLAVTLAEAA